MPRSIHVVIAGPADSYRLGAYVRAAHRLGAIVSVATDRPVALAGTAHQVDFASDATLPPVIGPTDAVVAADAVALVFTARAGGRAGVRTANPLDAVLSSLDKSAQRHAAARADVAQPAFRVVARANGNPVVDVAALALEIGFPAVVKPVSLTASRGVIRVEDPLDARAAAAQVGTMVAGEEPLLVECFIAGGEVAVEGLLDGGHFHLLAIFDKPGAPQGPTFPETILVSPSRLPAAKQHDIVAAAAKVCAAVGLRHGPVHVEFRIDEGGRPQFLELAARTIGGRCASMLSFTGGVSLEELVLRQALGLPYDPRPEAGAVGVLMMPVARTGTVTAVMGADEVAAIGGIDEVIIEVQPGERVAALPQGDRYAGFVFARGPGPADVEAALSAAQRTLRIEISPEGPW